MDSSQSLEPAALGIESVTDVARALALAFVTSPWADFCFPVEERAERLERSYVLFLSSIAVPHLDAWIMGPSGAAIWWDPSRTPPPKEAYAEINLPLEQLYGDRLAAVRELDRLVAAGRPSEPARILLVLGVDPQKQGCGLGTLLVREGLRTADQQGLTTLVETSTASNVRFYERFGFSTYDRCTAESLTVWMMRRSASSC